MARTGKPVNVITGEIWKEVPHKKSEVQIWASNMGRVKKSYITKKGVAKEYLLNPQLTERNYYKITIKIPGSQFSTFLGKLVLSAFDPVSGFINLGVLYIDKNGMNCKLENLIWSNSRADTFKYNNTYPTKNMINETRYISPVSGEVVTELVKIPDSFVRKMIRLHKKGITQIAIAREFGVSQANVSMIIRGLRRSRTTEIIPKKRIRVESK